MEIEARGTACPGAVDSSCLVALAFGEGNVRSLRKRLRGFDQLDKRPALVGVPLGDGSVLTPLGKVDSVFSVAIEANF